MTGLPSGNIEVVGSEAIREQRIKRLVYEIGTNAQQRAAGYAPLRC